MGGPEGDVDLEPELDDEDDSTDVIALADAEACELEESVEGASDDQKDIEHKEEEDAQIVSDNDALTAEELDAMKDFDRAAENLKNRLGCGGGGVDELTGKVVRVRRGSSRPSHIGARLWHDAGQAYRDNERE